MISALNLATTTQLGTKQNVISNTVSVSSNELTTAGDVSIGGIISSPNQISFRAIRQGDKIISTSVHLP